MAVSTDWVHKAAEEIRREHVVSSQREEILDVEELITIIEGHCPFKKDVVYEEVTETSRKLDEILEEIKRVKRNLR